MPAFLAAAAVAGAVSAGLTAVGLGVAGMTISAAFWGAFSVSAVMGALGSIAGKKQINKDAGSFSSDAASRMINVRQPIAPRRVIVGECVVGGVYAHMQTTDSDLANQLFNVVIALTGHQIEAVEEFYFDGTKVSNDTITGPSSGLYNIGASSAYSGFAYLNFALGTADQAAHTIPGASNWTSAHKLSGCANLYVRLVRANGMYPAGMPNITVKVRGANQIYDPRESPGVTRYTRNPALIIAWYLTGSRYTNGGMGIDYATGINESALITAANICDERVTNVYQPAFTVTAGSPSPNTITFASDQLLINTGDAVRYKTTSSEAAPLTNTHFYYYIKIDATTGQLASTYANATAATPVPIVLTGTGSGTQTLERATIFTADNTTDILTYERADARHQTGDRVAFEGQAGDSLPAPLAGIDTGPSGSPTPTYYYYVIRVNDSSCKLANTYNDALAGNAIDITSAGSGTLAMLSYDVVRYTCDGTWTLDEEPKNVIDKLCTSMAGSAFKIGGRWQIKAGAYVVPTDTLDDGELRGAIQINPMPALRDSYNGVKGIISGPESNWQPTDFPAVTSATYVSEDDGIVRPRDIQLPFTIRTLMAQRLAKLDLERARQAMVFTAPCKLSAFRFQAGDTLSYTFTKYGWTPKVFEVMNGNFAVYSEGGVPMLGWDLTLRETASTVYDWTLADDGAALDLAPNTTLAAPLAIPNSDRAYYSPGATANVSALGDFSKGRTVLALADHTSYPILTSTLRATFSGQFVCGGTAESAYIYFFVQPYTSKPTTAGTLAIAYSGLVGGVATYDVTGTATDFTVLAANDYIYSANGRPLFKVYSITDATHCKVQIFGGAVGSSALFPVSGWSWTAYRPGASLSNLPSSDLRDLAINAVQDVTFRTGVSLEPTSGVAGAIVVMTATSLAGNTINVNSPAIDSQWVVD
jgi:hypothetical protein